MADKISVRAAARALDVHEHHLYARAEEGLITVERRPTGRTRALVDLEVCRAEVTALRCQAPGCTEPARRAGRFCGPACRARKYAPEIRRCENEQCGDLFVVPGHRAKEPGAGRFCSQSCVATWRWTSRQETFPQSQLRGEPKACRRCGRTRYRPPSHLRVEYCADCIGEVRREWLRTEAGREHRRHLEAEQRQWWQSMLRKIDEERGTALLTSEVIERAGPMSVGTVTRYRVGPVT